MNELDGYRIWVQGREKALLGHRNTNLQKTLAEHGLLISADCGGLGTCGKCWIAVTAGEVEESPPSPARGENKLYLACRTYPRGEITVCLPTERTAAKGIGGKVKLPVNQPLLKKVALYPEYPDFEQQQSLQQTLIRALAAQGAACWREAFNGLEIIRQLHVLIEKPATVTAVLFQEEIIALEAGDTGERLYGVAFDIGTTTVAGMLVDLRTNEMINVCARTNPQISFGADVISRIRAAHELTDGLQGMAQAVRQCLNQIVEELCLAAKINQEEIYGASIVGNTTMIHLLLEMMPTALIKKPYAATFNHLAALQATEIDLAINPNGRVVILPNIASFIGSDTTGAVLAVDQDKADSPSLLVDLGTNGEMVIGDKTRLFACSTAAGPAFEGAHIRDGMRAVNGAIQDVRIAEDVTLSVIGDGPAQGICGSGMIKTVAEMLQAGIINASGRFDRKQVEALPPAIARRLRQRDGQWEFILTAELDNGRPALAVTQSDIRQIQLVKASICTGIEYLLERAGLTTDICLHLAGAFGNYVDVDSACRIGMFPGFTADRIQAVGNAAGVGAMKALADQKDFWRGARIVERVEYVELAAQPDFQQKFLRNLQFFSNLQ